MTREEGDDMLIVQEMNILKPKSHGFGNYIMLIDTLTMDYMVGARLLLW